MPLWYLIVTNVLYVGVLQPFALLHFLPFRRYLNAKQQKKIVSIWMLLFLLEVGAFTLILLDKPMAMLFSAYFSLGFITWVPQLLLCLCFTKKFWSAHIFILAFRAMISGIIYTFTRAFFLTVYPDRPFSDFFFWHILLYGAGVMVFFPFLLNFFNHFFEHFEEALTRRYWRYVTVIPVLIAGESLYLSIYDSQEVIFDLLLPRFILLIILILLLLAIRSSQAEVYKELRLYEKEHELQQQLVSAANYVKMSKESRARMEVIYQEKKQHLDRMLTLVEKRDRDGFMDYVERLGAKFNQTKLPQYCQNVLINAALTVYLSRARELGIPVTTSIDLPRDLPASGDLSIVLSNLVENALIASQKQKPSRRSITVLALRQGPSLNILVKNMFDAPVPLNEDGLPVTHVKGHGIGMQSLARFRDKYEASVLCQSKDGWFLTYMQVPLAHLKDGEEK